MSRRAWLAGVTVLLALASPARAQDTPAVFGAFPGTFHFTTPTTLADSACVTIPGSIAVNLYVAHVEHRRAGAPTWSLASVEDLRHPGIFTGGVLEDLNPDGGERLAVRYLPPTSGLWELRVIVFDYDGRPSCPGSTIAGLWNLGERPAAVDLELGP